VAGAKLRVDRDQLAAAPPESSFSPPSRPEAKAGLAANAESEADTAYGQPAETDLRGLRVDEALDRLEEALDLAQAQERHELRVIHGIGTGALRSAVRERVSRHRAVVRWLEAAREEGGAGATRLVLREDGAGGGAGG
ncbi:MAG TPA: Smr/MutS family protein, partial [Myxococcota bacterium]|nr:Smr/MutS family protein [Myxococcota bacterium]